jgi:hypothetical protein
MVWLIGDVQFIGTSSRFDYAENSGRAAIGADWFSFDQR